MKDVSPAVGPLRMSILPHMGSPEQSQARPHSQAITPFTIEPILGRHRPVLEIDYFNEEQPARPVIRACADMSPLLKTSVTSERAVPL